MRTQNTSTTLDTQQHGDYRILELNSDLHKPYFLWHSSPTPNPKIRTILPKLNCLFSRFSFLLALKKKNTRQKGVTDTHDSYKSPPLHLIVLVLGRLLKKPCLQRLSSTRKFQFCGDTILRYSGATREGVPLSQFVQNDCNGSTA